MAVKVDDPRDVQSAYDERFNQLRAAEQTPSQSYSDAGIDQAEAFANDPSNHNDYGNDVRDKESTAGSWANNFTGKQQSKGGGLKAFGDKAKILFKKKGATAAIIALLGGGASVPFLGAASLPFSIIGNMDAKSMMHGLEQYSEDYMGFSIFNTSKSSVSSTANKIKGLRDTEIAQLKAQGVELDGPTKTITGKTTFTSVKFEGQTYHAGAEFNNAMKSNPAFRKAMVFNKGSYWKSAKSSFAAKVKSLYKIDPNPDLSGKDAKEKNKKLFAESVEGSSSHASTSNTDPQKDKNGVDPNAAERDAATKTAGDLSSEITAEEQRLAAGNYNATDAIDSNNGNIGGAMQRQGYDLAGDATKSLGGKIWSYVNPLGILDTACTIYGVANTANTLARTVALFNIVRFAMTIRATIERAKAGDDNGQDTQYLMDLIQQKDPSTGQSFDETSYASFLFNGTLSSEPSSVSAFGGQAMIGLYLTMHAVHALFGQISNFVTLGGSGSSSRAGRQFLKTVCGVAQNIGVQIVATVGSLVVGFFTGGGSVAAEEGAVVTVKTAMQVALKKVMESVGKDALKAFAQKELAKVSEEGILKYAARNSWKAFTTVFKSMVKDPVQMLGLLAAGAGAFGMGYIIDALAGGNIAGYIQNGFSAFDAVGTGWNQYESVNGIASGGNMATYAQATAYQQTQQQYDNQYVADMQYQAKDTPFDLKTPYSTLGAALLGMQKTIGISASLSLPSTLMSVASLPFKLPSLFTAHADTAPTPQQIGDQVNNPFFQSSQIAVTTTGSPQVVFQKHYTFQDVLDKLVDSSNPQMTYDGDDQTTGAPMLSIIPGSDLDKYAQACHNPDKTEADPEFQNDDNSNAYDTDMCIPGGSKYDSSTYPLYDDAIRFIGQVSPDASSANSSTGSGTSAPSIDMPANAVAQGAGWALKDNTDYSSVSCAAGTTDGGVYTDKGNGTTVRVCEIKGQKIASVISQNVVNLLAAATSAGLNITLSSGLRTYEEQVALRNSNCGGSMTAPASSCHPPTAIPGQSNHEKGTAVDWGLNGQSFCYPNATCAAGANAGYDWFMKNAGTYGFHKLSSEAWHWSTDGQ